MSLKKVKDYPLSDGDIRRILGSNISIKTYPDLANMRSIDECFDSQGRCILLFLTSSPTSGHWCCLLKKADGIHFFDPYGDKPEEQLENVPQSRLEAMDELQPYLSELLKGSGKPIFYNTHAFQKSSSSINTCGRHCVARCLYAPYSLAKYKKIVASSGMSPDDFVSGLTFDKLRK
jgi:hypothetical protein